MPLITGLVGKLLWALFAVYFSRYCNPEAPQSWDYFSCGSYPTSNRQQIHFGMATQTVTQTETQTTTQPATSSQQNGSRQSTISSEPLNPPPGLPTVLPKVPMPPRPTRPQYDSSQDEFSTYTNYTRPAPRPPQTLAEIERRQPLTINSWHNSSASSSSRPNPRPPTVVNPPNLTPTFTDDLNPPNPSEPVDPWRNWDPWQSAAQGVGGLQESEGCNGWENAEYLRLGREWSGKSFEEQRWEDYRWSDENRTVLQMIKEEQTLLNRIERERESWPRENSTTESSCNNLGEFGGMNCLRCQTITQSIVQPVLISRDTLLSVPKLTVNLNPTRARTPVLTRATFQPTPSMAIINQMLHRARRTSGINNRYPHHLCLPRFNQKA